MTRHVFPTRIETDRLVFERFCHQTVDAFEFYEFASRDDWQGDATDPMPWFRFQTIDDVAGFIDHAESQWGERESARYLLRTAGEENEAESRTEAEFGDAGEIIGTTAYVPNWEKRYAGSDVVLSKRHWGRGYGLERARPFVELTFEHHDLDAYCTSCATDNQPSRRMIEKLIETYGGQYEGRLRQFGAPHPDGTVTDQHRFSITREEYERATAGEDSSIVDVEW